MGTRCGPGQQYFRTGRDRAVIAQVQDKRNKASYSNELTRLVLISHHSVSLLLLWGQNFQVLPRNEQTSNLRGAICPSLLAALKGKTDKFLLFNKHTLYKSNLTQLSEGLPEIEHVIWVSEAAWKPEEERQTPKLLCRVFKLFEDGKHKRKTWANTTKRKQQFFREIFSNSLMQNNQH